MANLFEMMAVQAARRGATRKWTPQLEQIEQSESWLSQLATLPLEAGKALLNAIDWIDATTRAGIGQMAGVEGTGRETPFGQAPTGRELLGIGEGTEGKLELGDVLGFGTEVLASPFMLLGIGIPSKAGTAALRAGKMAALARGAGATKLPGIAIPQGKALAALAREMGKKPRQMAVEGLERLGMGLGEQAKAGYRPLLSFDIPGLVNVPLIKGAPAMRGLGALGRGIAWPFKPITKALRASGRIGDPLYDALIDIGRATERGTMLTAKELGKITTLAAERVMAHPERAQQYFAQLAEKTEGARSQYSNLVNEKFDRAATAIGEREGITEAKRAATLKRIEFNRDRALQQVAIPEPLGPLDAVWDMIVQGAEKYGVPKQLVRQIKNKQAKFEAWQAQYLAKAKSPEAARQVVAMRRGKLAREIHLLEWRSEFAEDVIRLMPEDMRKEVMRVRDALGEQWKRTVASGVTYEPLGDSLLNYFPHVITPEGRAWIKSLEKEHPFKFVVSRTHTTTSPHFRKRSAFWRGLTVPQINDLARQMGLPEGQKLFHNSVEDAVLKEFASVGHATAGAHLWSGAIRLFAVDPGSIKNGIPIEEVIVSSRLSKVGTTKLPLPINSTTGQPVKRLSERHVTDMIKGTALEGKVIPEDIAKALGEFDVRIRDDRNMERMFKFFDKINSVYRVLVTQLFPGYHARNEMSNWFMMYMAGMRNPLWIKKAYDLQIRMINYRRVEAGLKPILGGKIASEADQHLYREMVEHGSVGQGTFAQETIEQFERGFGKRGTSAFRGLAQKASRGGQALEDNSKAALFMFERQGRGKTAMEAGEQVRKFLFDYADLSKTETQYLRRMAYFYTFMRKNIPLMVEQLLLDPRKGRLYGYATGAVGSRREGRYEALPPWITDVEPFDFGRDEEGNRIFATLGLPPEDIFRWSSQGKGVLRVAQKVAASLAPTFRVPIEALTKTSLAMGKPKQPISPLVQKGLEYLPESVSEQLGFLHGIERAAPTSRFTGSLRQALQSAGAMEQPGWREPTGVGQAALAFGTGVRLTTLEEGEAGFRNEIRRIALSLDRLKSLGRDKSERAKQLRRLRSRLQKRLD